MKIISLNKGSFAFFLGLLLWCSHMQASSMAPRSNIAFWQSTVSGIVSDGTGPLQGVTIYVKGTSSATVSDDKGHYIITAARGSIVVFSFMGFAEVEREVTDAVMDIVMQEDTAQLQEVVINAGYYSVKDKHRTGSIARITSQDIENQPVTNILATMQGRMAGVSVTQTSGVPGGGFDIRIRGINSLRSDGNSPLYIINGVPYANDNIGAGVTGTVIAGQRSPLNSLNPADIESIEVLKDADATAIYGSRGANGVVLITTKKGKAGKTAFAAMVRTGVGSVAGRIKLMDTGAYLQMRREAFANDGIEPGPADYDVNGTWDQDRNTDWQEVLTGGTAILTDYNASISGGSDQTQFLISGTYHKQTTVFPGDFDYRRGNVLSNISHRSSDNRFRLDFSGNYSTQRNNLPGQDLTLLATQLAPNAPELYDENGNLNWENSTWTNPLSALESKYKANTSDLIANTLLSYSIVSNLDLKSSFGYTETRFDDSTTMPSTMYDPAYGLGSNASTIAVNSLSRQSWIIEPQLNWRPQLGDVRFDLLAGATFQHRQNHQLVQEAGGYTSNSMIYNLSAASYHDVLQDLESKYRYQAVFARANINWDGRYILNLTGRRDGSSRFGPGRQFANFGAVGAAWVFSQENWLQDRSIISFGKLRASYGTAGNDQIGDYQFLNTYSPSGNNYGGVVGLQPSRLFNPDFGWETNRKVEAALELGLLKDRIYLTAAWFRNRSSNQLVGVPLPGTTGFSSIQANLDAEVENRGIELTLRTSNIESRSFNWTTNFNISFLKNKLLSFPGLKTSSYSNQYIIGESINIVKLYKYEGIDPETGLYDFKDFNGDGLVRAPDDKQHFADLNPDFFGGLQNTFAYKGLEFNFLFQFVKQQSFSDIYSLGTPGSMANQSTEVLSRWQQPGDSAAYQRYTTGADAQAQDSYYKFIASDAAIQDSSFIRLKNISLSYALPADIVKGLSCRIFAEAQNVLTITRFKGADPESRFINRLPPLKVVSAGIQFNF